VQTPAKAQLAGCVETHPCVYLAAFTAFRIVNVPIITRRNKDVERERVVFGLHCSKLGLDIAYRCSKSLQRILKAYGTNDRSSEHIGSSTSRRFVQ